ncbi:MAG: low specificity L-threonine aldolase [Deltaproteobacteria bacterium]|nr:low specificity L-threonine aldolase [Deltaproteobacteria bacterium]
MRHKSPRSFEKRQFASDNYSGICPEAWAALSEANNGHAPSYGEDRWTAEASNKLREIFEIDCEVYFTFNGTAANSLALASLCQSYHSIICSDAAHVETDECGAPEFFSNGTKILLAPNRAGKLTPEAVREIVEKRSDIHYPKPRAISLTQSTELGTVYSVAELDAIREVAHKLDLSVHMDGARFSNAVASLNVAPKEITWKVGVDVLCFGGTKIGLPVGEAVVFFNKELAAEFDYRCKQAGQLASKMRFLSAPWLGLLTEDVWLKYGHETNRLARMLAAGISVINGAELLYPCEANGVFVRLPERVCIRLRERGWHFYGFIGNASRFMCSWDTTEADVAALLGDLKELSS